MKIDSILIGEIRIAKLHYYDSATKTTQHKNRPVLVIAKSDEKDYVILPISSVNVKENINEVYDLKIDPRDYPKANLAKTSYVRTHKQTITNYKDFVVRKISSLKDEYPDLYETILQKREKFSDEITKQSRS